MGAAHLSLFEGHREHLCRRPVREDLARFLHELNFVELGNLRVEQVALNQHRAALVALLDHPLAAPRGEVDIPHRQRHGDDRGEGQRGEQTLHCLAPGEDHFGYERGLSHERRAHAVVAQAKVDTLHFVEPNPVSKGRRDPLDAVFVERQRQDDCVGEEERVQLHENGYPCTLQPHEHLGVEDLAAASELSGISRRCTARKECCSCGIGRL